MGFNMKKIMSSLVFGALLSGVSTITLAAPKEYKFDIEGAHAFVQFKAKHLGISWLYGRFNDFDGSFTYDPENDANNKVSAKVDVSSVDSNHAERDVHLRKDDLLNVDKFKYATFESTKYKTVGKNKAELTGKLTLMGITKEITLDVDLLGKTVAPWEKGKNLERIGFEGKTMISTSDFGMKAEWVGDVELIVSVEGIGPIK